MSVLFVALPIALLLGGAAVIACVRCISAGQYDDLETPSVRMLIDDRPLEDTADGDEPRTVGRNERSEVQAIRK